MKRRNIALIGCLLFGSLSIVSCGELSSEQMQFETRTKALYEQAKTAGFEGTYEEWIDSIKGADGVDGKSITQILTGEIKGEEASYNIIFSDGSCTTITIPLIKGDKGDPGEAGPQGPAGVSVSKIEKTGTDETGLLDTYTITYSDGTTTTFVVTNGKDGSQGIQGIPGEDGHSPVISINAEGNWTVDGVDTGIKAQGPKGDKGDKGDTGEVGPQGPQGETGQNGQDGAIGPQGPQGEPGKDGQNGKSAYELYLESHPEYTKSEAEWLEDLVNDRLGVQRYHTVSFDTNIGNPIEPIKVLHGEKIPRPQDAITNDDGYLFSDWLFEGERWKFNIYPCLDDMVLTASWEEVPILTERNLCILGPSTIKVNGQNIKEWGGFDGSVGKMSEISYTTLTEKRPELASQIEEYNVATIHTISGIEVGHSALAGWTTKWGPNGELIDGTYCLKFGGYEYDTQNERDYVTSWIPSKESGEVTVLTPETYWVSPNYSEERDENGYDWNTNPVITAGAGEYEFFIIQTYRKVKGTRFCIACYKTKDLEEFVEPQKVQKGWKLTGAMNDWNVADVTTDFMTNNTITRQFYSGDEFMITKVFSDDTGEWGGELAWENVELPATGFKQKTNLGINGQLIYDRNIVCQTTGMYTVTVVDNNRIKIEPAA